jgi:Plasmid encoded RepA protein
MNRSVEVAKATHSEDASSIPEYPSSGGRPRIDFLARKFPGVKVRKVGADARRHCDFQSAASILHEMPGQLLVSKQKLRRAEAIACVRLKRQEAVQSLGFASRPFVLCGLPIKRPVAGELLHERRNGQFVLQVTGHPSYGLPWGQDRLVPIFLATLAIRQQTPRITFDSAAEMLDSFGLQQGGSQYRRLVAAFQRIFGATIFFGTDAQRERATVVHRARFNFMSEARIWYSKDTDQKLLPGDCQNMIVLSEEFYREIHNHPIPTDLEAAKALSSSPAALDLFMWLSYRCFTARGRERVPLFGDFGLISQLGSAEYARPRKFRERLDGWLDLVRAMWPECPACIDEDGTGLFVDRANAVLPDGGVNARH